MRDEHPHEDERKDDTLLNKNIHIEIIELCK